MPEGDTIHRAALTLRGAIEGHTVAAAANRFDAPDASALVGQIVFSIEARGKHLLFGFDPSGSVLHTHMGMTGAWHAYRTTERWRKPRKQAAVALTTERAVCVCFTPKTIELLTASQARRHPYLGKLGPDILATTVDWTEILNRFRRHNASPIGEALLDQTIVCGIGNVYKSEVLFAEHLNPYADVASLDDGQLQQLVTRTRKLMLRNLAGHPRRTRFHGDNTRQWVYGRQGEHCLRCGETVRMRRQGNLGRSTYWCATCQPKIDRGESTQTHGA